MFDSYLNPNYGDGIFRRKIILSRLSPKVTTAAMEDNYHALSIRLEHDRNKILSLDAKWDRRPFSACSGGSHEIQALVGKPLTTNILNLPRKVDMKLQCTHIFDTANLAISHCLRSESKRSYTIEIPDRIENRQRAKLNIDKKCALDWLVEDGVIIEPGIFKGVKPLKGLSTWASSHLPKELLEPTIVLQRSLFVSAGCRYDLNAMIGQHASKSGPPSGSCYASQPEVELTSIRIGRAKDFTDCDEEMLLFVDNNGQPI